MEKTFFDAFNMVPFERDLGYLLWVDQMLHREGSGLHLGNIDYDNTLAVGAASNRRDGQRLQRALQVREEVGMTDGLFEKR